MTKKDESSIFRLILRNPVSANILMVLLLVGGIFSYNLSVREIFPEVNFDMISVSVPYPGADPDEIEEGICRPMEESLEGISGVKKITTRAREGLGLALVEVLDGYDVNKIKDDVDNRINAITTFPTEAEKPIIAQNQFRSEVLMISIWGELPLETLKETAYDLREDLLNEEEISSVTLIGDQHYEISVEVSESKLEALNLTHAEIAEALKQANLNLPGGQIYTEHEDIRLRFIGRRYNAEEYGNIVIKTDSRGGMIRLKDIAVLKDTFDPDNRSISLFEGKPCIVLQVNKTGLEDSIKISEIAHQFVEGKKKTLPEKVNLTIWSDNSRLIQDRIDLLTRNGAIGLCLVFFFLWLFLDFRLSFWVTLGVPISLSGAFIVMYLAGVSINMVSLFALILVLGIIVDDAIIVGESIYVHRKKHNSFDASVYGTRSVLWPVFAAVMTSVAAFLPLFHIDGILGKFIYVMPIPIVAALLVSLVEALYILPTHLRHLPVPNSEKKPKFILFKFTSALRSFFGGGLMKIINNVYGPMMKVILRWKYAAIAFSLCIVGTIAGMFQGGFLKLETFPSSDTDFLFTHIIMPVGTPLNETKKRTEYLIKTWKKTAAKYEKELGGEKLTKAMYSITGGNITPDDIPQKGTHLSSLFIEMMPTEKRGIFFKDIMEEWSRQTGFVSGAEEVQFEGYIGGPPTADVDIIFRGSDENIINASNDFKRHLQTYEGVYDITSSYKKGKTEFLIELTPEAENFGVSLLTLASQLRDSYYGNEVMKIQRERDEVRVMIRLPADERKSISDFKKLKVKNNQGIEIPVSSVARLKESNSFSIIERENGKRYINVQASVLTGVNATDVMDDIKTNYLSAASQKFDVTAEIGYRAQDTKDTQESMKKGFAIAVMVIYLIIATIFKSYLQPLIIVFTIPFGIMGAIFGHFVYGLPVSTMSFFGMIALTGVVVNDSIVYIEAVNNKLHDGDSLDEALISGGKLRFRAIILTTLTTFGGISPMILEKSLQAQVLVPMAISVAFGLVFATFSTLIAIPCLLSIGNDIRRLTYILIHGKTASPEEVEPRSSEYYVRKKRGGMI